MSFWFFLSPKAFQNNKKAALTKDIIQHLKASRLGPGDSLVLSDGEGRAFNARLDYLTSKEAQATILNEVSETGEPLLHVTLYLGISKGDKMDQAIRQAVELGVKKIVPVLAERTVVRFTADKGKEKAKRWQKISESAASQCRRSFIPPVLAPHDFDEMLGLLQQEELVLVPWEEEKETGILQLAGQVKAAPQSLAIFTGPEGGISPEEIAKLKKLPGVYPVTLGPRILRAETAPLSVLSIVMCLWGDLGESKTKSKLYSC